MPGLRGMPAVTITTSESFNSAYSLVPLNFGHIAFDRSRLGQVERLALRHAVDHVE